jgi:hypothetical protein
MELRNKWIGIASSMALLTTATPAFSFDMNQGHPMFHLGGYISTQGKARHIDINNLIGDYFSLDKSNDANVLFGLGYMLNGPDYNRISLQYGVNAFYLPQAHVRGDVTQEQLFTNLSYKYTISHIPVYASVKASLQSSNPRYGFTADVGIGPNFMSTSNFSEASLDGGITQADNIFSGKTVTNFSAMAGVGVKMNDVFGKNPLECGYRFLYLGNGSFHNNNSQVLNTLKTGDAYAQAIMCTATV